MQIGALEMTVKSDIFCEFSTFLLFLFFSINVYYYLRMNLVLIYVYLRL